MADRLTLARALEQGGIGRDAGKHIATEIYDAVHENVATKTDLRATEGALRADLQATEAALTADLQAAGADLRATEAALRNELQVAFRDLKIWTGSLFALVVAIVSGVVTIFHFLGPAGSGL